MFGDLIYFNKKKVAQYSALILGKNIETRVTDKDNIEDISANYLLECSNFEKLLQRRDDFKVFQLKMLEYLPSLKLLVKSIYLNNSIWFI